MVGDWNCLKYRIFACFCDVIVMCTETFWSPCVTKSCIVTLISFNVSESELWQSCCCKSVASQCWSMMQICVNISYCYILERWRHLEWRKPVHNCQIYGYVGGGCPDISNLWHWWQQFYWFESTWQRARIVRSVSMCGTTVHKNIFLLITNLMHFFVYLFIHFISLHVSRVTVLIIRRSNCINTSSGMISVCKWLLGMPVLTREMKWINKYMKKCIRLVINQNLWRDARSRKYKT